MLRPAIHSNFGISVVVPTFNRAHLIGETLESLLAQDRAFAEIIVIDDGSTDDTPSVLGRYRRHIRMIRTANQGVQQARNLGVSLANSEWVAFCDSDDLLVPSFVETIYVFVTKHPNYQVIYCNFSTFIDKQDDDIDKFAGAPATFFEGGTRLGDFIVDVPDIYCRSLHFQPLFMSGMTISSQMFAHIGGFDSRLRGVKAEDWEFTLRACAQGRVALCTRPLARVRKHTSNDSADSMLMSIGEVTVLKHALCHHDIAQRYAEDIAQAMDMRRMDIFNAAFARGEFALAREMWEAIAVPQSGLRTRLKLSISCLPAPVRKLLWRATQM